MFALNSPCHVNIYTFRVLDTPNDYLELLSAFPHAPDSFTAKAWLSWLSSSAADQDGVQAAEGEAVGNQDVVIDGRGRQGQW